MDVKMKLLQSVKIWWNVNSQTNYLFRIFTAKKSFRENAIHIHREKVKNIAKVDCIKNV
jgi:hypothetical protein